MASIFHRDSKNYLLWYPPIPCFIKYRLPGYLVMQLSILNATLFPKKTQTRKKRVFAKMLGKFTNVQRLISYIFYIRYSQLRWRSSACIDI